MPTKKQLANLKPVRSKSEARERGAKGGIASGVSRRGIAETKKLFKKTRTIVQEIDAEYVTEEMLIEMWLGLAKKAIKDPRYLELYFKLLGLDNSDQTEEAGARIIFCGEDDIEE